MPAVDPTLRRRLAWGLLAGYDYNEVAEREGITRAEVDRILATPGMIVLLRIWKTFFTEGDRGDLPLLLEICKWALAHVLRHARERAVGIGVGYSFLCAFALKVALGPTLKLLCAHIQGVIGRRRPKRLAGVRGELALLLCWVIETAMTQDLIDRFGDEFLIAQDHAFALAAEAGALGESLKDWAARAEAANREEAPQPATAEAAPVPSPHVPGVSTLPRRPLCSRRLAARGHGVRPRAPLRRDILYELVRPGRERCSWPPPVRVIPIGSAA